MNSLPERLDDETLAMVEACARSPIPALEPCREIRFKKWFQGLESILPRKASSEEDGDRIINAYYSMLGRWPNEAIDYLAATAMKTCKWFPTIAECNEILAGWTRADEAYRVINRAKVLCRRERQARFDETMAALEARSMSLEEVASLPEGVKRIAIERGYLRLLDGEYVIRHENAVPVTPEPEKAERKAPNCGECQDVGRVLTMDGEEADCPSCAATDAL